MPPVSKAAQLESHRVAMGEDPQFVMRCLDGRYGPLANQVAVDIVARERVDGDEPTPTAIADAIIAEVRQTEHDARSIAA